MSIKLLSPCPEDDGSTSLSGKNFVAPKKKYNPINLYSIDFELEAAKLDLLDPTGKLNSFLIVFIAKRLAWFIGHG